MWAANGLERGRMRTPKYRAWYDGKMYEVAKLDLWGDPDQATCDLASINEELYEIYLHEVILMQSTGLKDKDYVEIYEGDIVKVMDSTFAIVKYSDDRGAYYLDCEKKIGDVGLICQYDTIKRVGNVYETPELLEGEV